jgi:membrane protein implicated in regulation of membrane protease activity
MTLNWIFLVLAMIGCTILVCQFVLMLIGLGGDLDIADDLPDDLVGTGDFAADPELSGHGVGHGNFSTWLFGVLSLKTLTAAAAFFGLAGCAASAAKMSPAAQLTLATLAGLGALYGVHWLMHSLLRLSVDGTARLERAVGNEGTVYLTVPARGLGAGKVHFKLQSRLVEYRAVTQSEEPLRTGSKVRIVSIAGAGTVEVEPAVEPKPSSAMI